MTKDEALKLVLLSAMITLTGCNSHTDANGVTTYSTGTIDKEEAIAYDQCLRATLFQQCLKALPAGPVATKYNDWDEVVSECDKTAARMSRRKAKYVKGECRHD